jgi:transcriptional regulator with XRE-family HTH domain
MNFANIDVKKYIAEKGYTQKQIAKKLGITPEWFSRMLKNELADEEKQAVMMAIDGDLRLWRKRHMTYIDLQGE